MEIERYLEAFYDRLEKQFQGSLKALEGNAETTEIAYNLRQSKYSVFYTNPFHTLKEGLIYFLGLNPGGKVSETYPHETFDYWKNKTDNWCEYKDAEWADRKRSYRPGEAPLQIKVQNVLNFILAQIGIKDHKVEDVFCTNLLFYRSLDSNFLNQYGNIDFFKFHEEFLNIVKPKIIVCCGNGKINSPYSKFMEVFGTKSEQPSPLYGTFSLKWFAIENPGWRQGKALVIGLPHLSRYKRDIEKEPAFKKLLMSWKEA